MGSDAKFVRSALACLALLPALLLHQEANALVKRSLQPYSETSRVLESQPLDPSQARLVYWDQSEADALGLTVSPGRVGFAPFEKEIIQKLGFEIKRGTNFFSKTGTRDRDGNPYFFVEQDAHHGAGRAGYIEVQPGVWVNLKGIGVTGSGGIAALDPSPPKSVFVSHADGSMPLEEAIKEAILARVADAEFSSGANRVLAIITTGRTLGFEDGRTVPLAIVVRAPLRRFDQPGGDPSSVVSTLAEGNAKRFMKGDFVNKSNLGAEGEWVDFGCMSFTCGYAPLKSSQNELMLAEGTNLVKDEKLYERRLGENLLTQMGIPEPHVQALHADTSAAAAQMLEKMARAFKSAVYSSPGKSKKAEPVLLDFKEVETEKLLGEVRFHEFFKEAASRFFSTPEDQRGSLLDSEYQRLLSLASNGDPELRRELSNFVAPLHELFGEIEKRNDIGSPADYAKSVREIAYFKNREVPDLTRPRLFSNAGHVADQFTRDGNAESVTNFIENTVTGNRFGTAPASEANIIEREISDSTEYYIRAFTDESGTSKLFAYPDLGGAKNGQDMFFRVSTDQGGSWRDFIGERVKSRFGDYFKLDVPHGALQFTWTQVQLAPFIVGEDGHPQFLRDGLQIRGPPLVTNERLGLAPSFARRPGVMRNRFSVHTSIRPEDLAGAAPTPGRQSLAELVKILDPQNPWTLREQARVQVVDRKSEARALYQSDPEFRRLVDQLLANRPENIDRAAERVQLLNIFKKRVSFICIWDYLRFLLLP